VAARSSSGGRGSKPLVVAVERLPLGAVLRPDQVRLSRVPGDLFPKGGFWRIEDVVGRPVVATIEADEPVLAARVAERGSGMGLAPMIPSGMRAASVRVNDVADVAGFILSGMHVDVLATGRAEGHSDTVTRTVLQDISVLSVGQTIQADAHNPSINAVVVTLLVKPDQAEALTWPRPRATCNWFCAIPPTAAPLKPWANRCTRSMRRSRRRLLLRLLHSRLPLRRRVAPRLCPFIWRLDRRRTTK